MNLKSDDSRIITGQVFNVILICAKISYLSATTVPKALHDRVNFLFEDLRQFGAVFVHP